MTTCVYLHNANPHVQHVQDQKIIVLHVLLLHQTVHNITFMKTNVINNVHKILFNGILIKVESVKKYNHQIFILLE